LSTVSGDDAKDILKKALAGLLSAVSVDQESPNVLYELYYEQKSFPSAIPDTDGRILGFPPISLDLAFNDATMTNVNTIWKALTKVDDSTVEADYMNFDDREGADDDDGFD
jgi:Rab proteins geranylgeranyltransferase component A